MSGGKFDLGALLADVSKLDTGLDGREKIEYIDLENLKADERNFYALTDIDSLASSIEFAGLQQPLRVRRDPEQEGKYIIVSGHRRHAALSQLSADGEERFRSVPCIVERGSGETSEVETMLQELRLIYGNSDTRQLSSADISKQAERVETLLYQLKEAGVEFPGRMRDHVAQACQVSASKLARLKTIREKLIPLNYREMWEDGLLPEQTAYALARMAPMMQEEIAKTCPTTPPIASVTERIQQMGMGYYLARERECPSGDEGCTHGKRFLARDAHANYSWDVGGCGCCLTCGHVDTCAYACPAGKAKAAENKKQAEARKEKKAEKQKRAEERTVEKILDFAERVNKAAGGDVDKFRAAHISLGKSSDPQERTFAWWNLLEDTAFHGKAPDLIALCYYIPSAIVLAGLCRELDCSMDYLMGLTDDIKGTQTPGNGMTWFPPSVEPEAGQEIVYIDSDGCAGDMVYHSRCLIDGSIPWSEGVEWWTPLPAP